MKKTRRIFLLVFVLLTMLLAATIPAAAEAEEPSADELYQEQLEASGAQEIWDKLPEETRRLLDNLGITGPDKDSLSRLTPQASLSGLLGLLADQAGGPLRSAGILLGIILLCALMDGMKQAVREPAISDVFQTICTLAACAAALIPVSGCIRSVCEAAESTSVFMVSFVPVYAGVLLTGGQVAAAASYQSIVLFVAELFSWLATSIILPLMTISLALGMTGSVTSGMKLDAVAGFINKTAVWLLSISSTLFVGLLSLQSLVGAAADTLGGRAIKFSLSSFVPVVGAFNTVKGCLGLLKSTLGGFGILATVLIVLPPMLECAAWSLCLSLCVMAADMLELKTMSGLLTAVRSVTNTLIGLLASCSLFMIIATSIMTLAGRGG